MKRLFFLVFLITIPSLVYGQFVENFTDGNFSENPQWIGDTDNFMVNSVLQLQLNDADAVGTSTSLLYAEAATSGETTWEFFVKLDFSPSASNHAKVYLSSNKSTLDGSLNGYFVKIGGISGNEDAIELFRQNESNAELLITGTTGAAGGSEVSARIKVVRTENNEWELFADYTGGSDFTLEGAAQDNAPVTGQYFGLVCKYTATRKDKFFFDDFFIDPLFEDTAPPILLNVEAVNEQTIKVYFDEVLEATSVETLDNYQLSGSLMIESAMPDSENSSIIFLQVSPAMNNLETYELTVTNISDTDGNTLNSASISFTFFDIQAADQYDIVITEIMADPKPSVGLPEAEFIELYNRSNKVIALQELFFSSGGTPQVLGDFFLLPDSYIIVCDEGDIASFSVYGDVVGLSSFPSLINSGDILSLTNSSGHLIHQLGYDLSWYKDNSKTDGGWTLEMVNPLAICQTGYNNWKASNHPWGGTPGVQNSVYSNLPDNMQLELINATSLSSQEVLLSFNKRLDIVNADNPSNYLINHDIGNPLQASIESPADTSVLLNLPFPLIGNDTFIVTVNNVTDCQGNNISEKNKAGFTLPKPQVLFVEAISNTEVDVVFSEPMEAASISNIDNYNLDNGIGKPISANPDNVDPTLAHLLFGSPFVNGTFYTLNIRDLNNLSETSIETQQITFPYYEPAAVERYDIIINEIYPAPKEEADLPYAEYIELYNRSEKIFNLEGFRLTKDGGISLELPVTFLKPDEYVVIYEKNEIVDFSVFGKKIPLDYLFSLNNKEGAIELYSPEGRIVDAIQYSDSWYGDPVKKQGGWSLERINPQMPCDGAINWRASDSELGGTPAQINSVHEDAPDDILPDLKNIYVNRHQTNQLKLTFSEALNIQSAANKTVYEITPPISVLNAIPGFPIPDTVILNLGTSLSGDQHYEITIKSEVQDCQNNPFGLKNSLVFAVPQEIEAKDVVINEILFNPETGGSDFIELYNRSEKVLDISEIKLENNFNLQQKKVNVEYLLFPDQYAVLTSDPGDISSRYTVESPERLFYSPLPTFEDSEGNISLIKDEAIDFLEIDAFDYNANMHYTLLDNKNGVSLERIDPEGPTQSPANWHSAASTAGFATPTFQNSQFFTNTSFGEDIITLPEETFSPDGDGYEDVLIINYNTEQAGYTANIHIYDASGRLIRKIVKNELLATEGSFKWDGITDEGTKARMGIYILWVEIFNPGGDVNIIKKTFVLAYKLD